MFLRPRKFCKIPVCRQKPSWLLIMRILETGTPNIAGAIGLAAAIEYLGDIGLDRIAACEHKLLAYATERLVEVPDLRLLGALLEKRLRSFLS